MLSETKEIQRRFTGVDQLWRLCLLVRHRSRFPLKDEGPWMEWPMLEKLFGRKRAYLYAICNYRLQKFRKLGYLDLVTSELPPLKRPYLCPALSLTLRDPELLQ